uniref:protein TALPID3 n=1 Tax=Euleptes europaea TaxID=460621 RepID=UPI00253FD953|nr:protein TALPID3 [Euleptes europaea]
MEAEENSGSNEESLVSLTAGDVLIRSTSFHMRQTPLPSRTAGGGAGGTPAAGIRERIRISVKKLREVSPPCHPEDSTLINEDCIPPALPANRPMSQKPTAAISRSATEAADIFISQYDAGQKEAVRAVFKQRIQNVPVFKEVKVHLLEHAHPDQKDSVKSTHSDMDSATTIAAATAAAVASAAPLLKVQSDLEAKVNSVSEMLNRLQETDKQRQRVTEQQASLAAQQAERPPCHQRVCKLEKQMTLFMEKRIQHLETLQQQQMNIQSHLINSALNSGGFQAVSVPPFKTVAVAPTVNTGRPLGNPTSPRQRDLFSTNPWNVQAYSRPFGNRAGRRQKSPLKTPAPRRYAPVPVSKDAKISHKMAKREQPIGEKENVCWLPCFCLLGGGRFLEQILNSLESPFSESASPWKEQPTSSKMPWQLERESRSGALQAEPFPVFRNPVEEFNPIERTAKKADDVLRDLGQLRREMQGILQEAKEWKSDMNGFMKQKDPVLLRVPEAQNLPKPSVLQTVQAPKSMLRDAERILRVVRKNKKVLEENLEAIVRAKDGSALHSFIDTLTANRDVLEEIRIRKTVDEWIKTISLEIKDEMARKAWEEGRPDGECRKGLGLKAQHTVRPTKAGREMKSESRFPQGSTVRRPLPAARAALKPARKVIPKASTVVQTDGYLSQIYGRPIYQGHRSTLKKSPYLRINSPPPKLKPPRPKLIESVRGTRVKSARTQTVPCGHSKTTSPKKSRPRLAPCRELQYLFSPIKEAPDASGPLEGHLIPMAVPLGQKQINSISPEPAGIIIGQFHPVTVAASIPPAPPKQQPSVQKPNIAVIEMKSEKKDPPKLSMQVLPNVDIDSVSSGSPSGNLAPSMPLPTQAVMQSTPEDSWNQEEEPKLPGTDFVDADLTQVAAGGEEGDDGIPEFLEPLLEFNRRGETGSPPYNGLPFPPVAPPPQPSADILDEIIERRETLENKLVSWVEQEVMARVISGMYPAQKEAVPDISSSESEESQAVSSDIVEAAGPEGFQLFVSAGVPVNSDMIRQFVSEALAETVAVMLGDREDQKPASAAGAPLNVTLLPAKDLLLATPLATPQATPPPSSPPLREPSPVRTPEPSPPASEIGVGVRQPMAAAEPEAAAASPVRTPAATPVATPPRVATPSPPMSERIPDRERTESRLPPNAWGDAELPLEEEKPSPPIGEGGYHPRAVIMSVAKDEELENLVSPPPPEPIESPDPRLQEPPIPSCPVHSLSSSLSPEESSLTATETETADRPISEGEVLFSYGQVVAMRVLAEEGLFLPNLSDSLASTLHDAHEMDYDPPSEGQVVLRPHRGHHRDPVLSLFSKLRQAPLASQEDVCRSEDTDNSAGELSEGQRLRLTRAAESILVGHSVYMDRPPEQRIRQIDLRAKPKKKIGTGSGGKRKRAVSAGNKCAKRLVEAARSAATPNKNGKKPAAAGGAKSTAAPAASSAKRFRAHNPETGGSPLSQDAPTVGADHAMAPDAQSHQLLGEQTQEAGGSHMPHVVSSLGGSPLKQGRETSAETSSTGSSGGRLRALDITLLPSFQWCFDPSGGALGDTDATHGPMSVAELEHPAPSAVKPKNVLTAQLDEAPQNLKFDPTNALFSSSSGFQSDADRTHVEPDSYLASLVAERGNVPWLNSLPAPAKMSVTVPSGDVEDVQSFSSIHGSSDSSGADTF